MGNEYCCFSVLNYLAHFRLALIAECAIAYRKNLVENEYLRLNHTGNGKRDTRFHSARKLLERTMLKLFKLRKLQYLRVFFVHELTGIAKHGSAEICILFQVKIAVKPTGKLQQCGYSSVHPYISGGRPHNLRHHLKQRGFTRSVSPHNSQHIALTKCKRHTIHRHELLSVISARQFFHDVFLQTDISKIAGYISDGNIFCFNYYLIHFFSDQM